jgi:hypothetical protein
LPTVKHFVLLAPRNDEALAALDALLFLMSWSLKRIRRIAGPR